MSTGNSSRIHHFKLVLLGDTAVGKSCLVVRFVRDEFFEFQEPTIGGKILCIGSTQRGFCKGGIHEVIKQEMRKMRVKTLVVLKGFGGGFSPIATSIFVAVAAISTVTLVSHAFLSCISSTAAFLTQTVQLDDSTVKFEIWYVLRCTELKDFISLSASQLSLTRLFFSMYSCSCLII